MLFRSAAAVGLAAAAVAVCAAQTTYTRALPPDKSALERLNLKTEWTLHIPIEGRRDTIGLVQTIGDQLFVQSKHGLFGAIEADTGKLQWWTQLGNGGSANVYPVAANARFVFVVHVTKLYAFYRHSGVVEFVHELGTEATTGPACDEVPVDDAVWEMLSRATLPKPCVYVVLAIRPGAGGAHRVAAYQMPAPIGTRTMTVVEGGSARPMTPVESLTNRYPTTGVTQTSPAANFERSRGSLQSVPTGGMSASRSPSLAVTPSVTPPYSLDTGARTPALNTMHSLRQPYTLRGENANNVQHTASLSTIPPSVAAALALSDLRPKGVTPKTQWEFGTTNRVLFPPLVSPRRLWGASDGKIAVAVSKIDGQRELEVSLPAQLSAMPSQAETTGYFAVGDGNLHAVDLLGGDRVAGLAHLWRANVGGLMNHTPFIAGDAVFAAGDNSGVARVERATGAITWKTDNAADRIIAANHEFVYVRDRQGRFLVYDAKRATDPQNRYSAPLSGMNLPEFNVPIVNTASDRVYLAADNGLIVCLRDASVKYRTPVRIAPPVVRNNPALLAPKVDPKAVEALIDQIKKP